MDCTLLLAAVWKKQSRCVLGQLGDGAVCTLTEREARQLALSEHESGVPANATWTIDSKRAEEHFRLIFRETEKLVGILLTSDGLDKEIYFRTGNVKKKCEWYFNLISSERREVCEKEIERRWDLLTSDAAYGFTDDMCLAALFRPGATVRLPEDATWLCTCGHRNRLESTWCENCDEDFLKVYRSVDFRQYGGKISFFTYMNAHPEEEWQVLKHEVTQQEERTTQPEVKEPLAGETEPEESGMENEPDPLEDWEWAGIQPSQSPTWTEEGRASNLELEPRHARETQGFMRKAREFPYLTCTLISFLTGVLCCAVIFGLWSWRENQALNGRIQRLERENQELRDEWSTLLEENQRLEEQKMALQTQMETYEKIWEKYGFEMMPYGEMPWESADAESAE